MSKYVTDLAERVAATFAFTFLSVFSVTDLSSAKGAAISATAAVLSILKGTLAGYLSAGETAGLGKK